MNTELTPSARKALEIIQNAGDENGLMTEEEYYRTQAELRKLGIMVATTMEDDEAEDLSPAQDQHGRTFSEVSIHPFAQQIADEDGEPEDGGCFNPSGSEWSDEFGDDLDDYPDEMFRKGWSVTSWVTGRDGSIGNVDDEEFPDFEAAIARAEELASQYRVNIDHCY